MDFHTSSFTCSRRAVLAGSAATLIAAAAPRRPFAIQTHVASAIGMLASAHLLLAGDEAMLIDTTFLKVDAARIADMIARSGRRLSRVIVTHAHPDHFLGAATIRARFPDARFLARPKVAAEIASIYTMATTMMGRDFGAALDTAPVVFEPFADNTLQVGDARFTLIDFAGGESHDSFVILTPTREEVIAGDTLYDGAHLYLADRDIASWRQHLDALAALRTIRARPGHGRPGPTASLIGTTTRYLDAFEREAARAADAETLIARMVALYPRWAARRLLRFSAEARFPNS